MTRSEPPHNTLPSPVRTRFAPSPTGELHVGGARTAILNWLLARHHGGAFVLRIEDTDLDRNVAGAEARILEDLRWLGLDWDEGPDVGGARGPYRQSERGGVYAAAAARLLEQGDAYPCTCPPVEEGAGVERRRCACAERPVGSAVPAGASVRFRVPDVDRVEVPDAVRGAVTFPAESLPDFIVLRADGRPTYNFAAAVDDAAMRITHVVRGADHLNNTPKQVLVYRALGHELPTFAHIPLILGPDRQKLSKRHGATSVGEHRRQGYIAEALLNYLSLLAWSSPSGEEVLPRERLIAEVNLSRVGASDAVFDPDKLRWLSSRYIQGMEPPDLADRLRPYIGDLLDGDEDRMLAAASALRDRISVLSEAPEQLRAFFGPRTDEQRAAREAVHADPDSARVLEAVHAALAALPAWDEDGIGAAIREAGVRAGARGRALFRPLRLALTGEEHGPELPRILLVLGRDPALALLTPENATFDENRA